MSFYKRFDFKVIVRVFFIMLNLFALSFIFGDNRLFFNQIILFIVLSIQVYELIRFLNYTNKELAKFILSIRHNDFSINFRRSKIGQSFEELHDAFDDVIQAYEDSKIEKQAQFEYLRLVVGNINVGIISLENDEDIVLMNKPAERVLNVEGIKNWKILKEKSKGFTDQIEALGESGRKLIEFKTGGDNQTLSVDVVSMKMLDSEYKLITFQDIRGEIEQKEIEAWHKLIRILTHEIMNSATPISSLTETMRTVFEKEGKSKTIDELQNEDIEDLLFSLKTIQRRSNGMLTFIDDYRKLTKVAKPKLQEEAIGDLFRAIEDLMKPELDKKNIEFHCENNDVLSLAIDTALIEQVLLNLVKNSMHALAHCERPRIELLAYFEKEKAIIEVRDN